ncbi:MAG: InlB B-repeat-containing protein [Methanomassiliicoccaceae archaeon]|nr:InlB B-repeat-containing protein [Methanomassiliicoccaceae archaeon]
MDHGRKSSDRKRIARSREGIAKLDVVIIAVGIVCALILINMYFIQPADKTVNVTLSSDGNTIGKAPVTGVGFADLNWLEETEKNLEPRGDLTFAGWYTDSSFEEPFYKFTQIRSDTTLYANWNELDISLAQTETAPVTNSKTCTFTVVNADISTIGSITWTVTDSFKSNNNEAFPKKVIDDPTSLSFDESLKKGMYDVTLTVTFDDGAEMTTRKTVIVDGIISNTTSWNDYRDIPRTPGVMDHSIEYSFDVMDYIHFAKMNWAREFRINAIASFAVYEYEDSASDKYVIQVIADKLKAMFDADPTMTKQDQANLVASFVNHGLSPATLPNRNSDYFFYFIPKYHASQNDGSVEYYRYPMESLYDKIMYGGIGDCDCHAILTAAIAKACGFDSGVMVMTYHNPHNENDRQVGHAVAAIWDDPSFDPGFTEPAPQGSGSNRSSFKEVDGYYACETFRPSQTMWVGLLQDTYQGAFWTHRVFVVG